MNPFQAPTEETEDVRGPTSEWYERLAKLRRRLNLSFLALLACLVGWVPIGALFETPPLDSGSASALFLAWAIAVIGLWITTQFHVYLVLKMTGTASGAALTVLILGLPLVGSISVMIATRRASSALRSAGYEVRFLGLGSKAMRD
jgi:hypothetical protein